VSEASDAKRHRNRSEFLVGDRLLVVPRDPSRLLARLALFCRRKRWWTREQRWSVGTQKRSWQVRLAVACTVIWVSLSKMMGCRDATCMLRKRNERGCDVWIVPG